MTRARRAEAAQPDTSATVVGTSRREPRRAPRAELEFHVLVLVTLGLVAFGLVMVYSASSARAILENHDPAYYLKRQAAYAVVGLIALAFFARLDYRLLRRLTAPLLLGSIALLAAALVIGTAVNGARRWISLGVVVVQPSELAKLAVALWLAALLARRRAPRTVKELAPSERSSASSACSCCSSRTSGRRSRSESSAWRCCSWPARRLGRWPEPAG